MESMHPLTAYRLRQDPPLTQVELAKRIGVSKVSVHRWETGGRKPDHELLKIITEVTGIPAAVLRPDLAELIAAPERARGPARPRRTAARAKSRAA